MFKMKQEPLMSVSIKSNRQKSFANIALFFQNDMTDTFTITSLSYIYKIFTPNIFTDTVSWPSLANQNTVSSLSTLFLSSAFARANGLFQAQCTTSNGVLYVLPFIRARNIYVPSGKSRTTIRVAFTLFSNLPESE